MIDTLISTPTRQMLLSCPQCGYEARSTFELRQHALSTHIFTHNSESTIADQDARFECEIFMCSFCGCSATNIEPLKEHLHLSHSVDLNDDNKSAIMAQRIVLESLDTDDYHCSSESDTESEPQPNSSPFHSKQYEKKVSLSSSSGLDKIRPDVPPTPSGASSSSVISITPTSDVNRRSPNAGKIVKQPRIPGQDWSKLIARSDKKFICLLCRSYVYSGRTEVIFHSVTRHLMATDIEYDLCNYGRLTEHVKRQIGRYFVDGMRIRSGVHYKDAKRVEAALFRSIELHLRYQPAVPNPDSIRVYTCSGCNANFTESAVAYAHVNDELRAFLPEFMRARSCPWSLSTREEWVWCVPDLVVQPLPDKPGQDGEASKISEPPVDVKPEPVKIVPNPKPMTVPTTATGTTAAATTTTTTSGGGHSGAGVSGGTGISGGSTTATEIEMPKTPLIAALPHGLLPVSLLSIRPSASLVGKPNPPLLGTNLGQATEHSLVYTNSPLGRIFKVNPS